MAIDMSSTLAQKGLAALRPRPPQDRRVIMEGRFKNPEGPLFYYATTIEVPTDATELQGPGYALQLTARVNPSGDSQLPSGDFDPLEIGSSYPLRFHGARIATLIDEEGRIFHDRTLIRPQYGRLTRTLEDLADRYASRHPVGLCTFDLIYDTLVQESLARRA